MRDEIGCQVVSVLVVGNLLEQRRAQHLASVPKRCAAVFDCHLPFDVLERTEPETADYIRRGESEGVSTGYLASRRDPWYSLDGREPAPFLSTNMGRSANGQPPFRIILNESRPIATNVYLMLYPKDPLRKRMVTTSRRRAVLAILNRILDEEWRTSRRAYGAAIPAGTGPTAAGGGPGTRATSGARTPRGSR